MRALRPHIGARLALPDGDFLGVVAARVADDAAGPEPGRVRAEADGSYSAQPAERSSSPRSVPRERARWQPPTGFEAVRPNASPTSSSPHRPERPRGAAGFVRRQAGRGLGGGSRLGSRSRRGRRGRSGGRRGGRRPRRRRRRRRGGEAEGAEAEQGPRPGRARRPGPARPAPGPSACASCARLVRVRLDLRLVRGLRLGLRCACVERAGPGPVRRAPLRVGRGHVLRVESWFRSCFALLVRRLRVGLRHVLRGGVVVPVVLRALVAVRLVVGLRAVLRIVIRGRGSAGGGPE